VKLFLSTTCRHVGSGKVAPLIHNLDTRWRRVFSFKTRPFYPQNITSVPIKWGTAVSQWLRRCATNRKVAGSIPVGVSGFFIDIKSFRSLYGPGVDSASNRNEYQEYFLGVKAAGA